MSKAKLWGGVFGKDPDALAWEFGKSLESDKNLLSEEFDVSLAHAQMLVSTGIIAPEDGDTLIEGIQGLREDIEYGIAKLPDDAEDIHGAIEWLLEKRIGDVAKRLHAGRSRNDQIATVTRLWVKRRCDELCNSIVGLQETVLQLADKHVTDPMPGYTHQQPAQPVTVGFWLSVYFWMLERDKQRFHFLIAMADESPLGSAACAGTSLPVDRQMTTATLGFSKPIPNALDAVSDRDFVGDALHACATLMQHLSRLSQEIVLFSTAEFGYLQLDDAYSTGSSIMPQKRNPDLAELIRARTATSIGNWTAFMSMMKALPLGYNRDQQEDKPPLFESVKICLDSLTLSEAMLRTATFKLEKMATGASAGYSTATTVCESLVASGIPFRTAHEIVGKVVKACSEQGLSLEEYQPCDQPELSQALEKAGVLDSIDNRTSEGGPSHQAMKAQLELAKNLLKKDHHEQPL